ncbi:MAG: hypothetical protein ACOYOJ_13935 [Alsobacter sp.]
MLGSLLTTRTDAARMLAAASLALMLAASSAVAQITEPSSTPTPAVPSVLAPSTPQSPAAPATPAPARPFSAMPAPVQRDGGQLFLSAALGSSGPAIRQGLVWRVFQDTQDGAPPRLVQESDASAPSFILEPGDYMVHVAFGLASAAKRVRMGGAPTHDSLAINAGGLVLGGVIGDTLIPAEKLRFNIYVPIGNDPEGRVVVENANAGMLVRLPEGSYRVVSTYGDSNAIASADLKVETGQVLEAVMRHKAATVTLKLVVAPGTEALANTAFSVLTPGGDTIREAIGAFPAMTLAEGEYVAIARNSGKVYTQEFRVRSGSDRDIEVLAK